MWERPQSIVVAQQQEEQEEQKREPTRVSLGPYLGRRDPSFDPREGEAEAEAAKRRLEQTAWQRKGKERMRLLDSCAMQNRG